MGGWWEYQQNAAWVGGLRFSRGSAAQSTLVMGGGGAWEGFQSLLRGPGRGAGCEDGRTPPRELPLCMVSALLSGQLALSLGRGNAEWRSETPRLGQVQDLGLTCEQRLEQSEHAPTARPRFRFIPNGIGRACLSVVALSLPTTPDAKTWPSQMSFLHQSKAEQATSPQQSARGHLTYIKTKAETEGCHTHAF